MTTHNKENIPNGIGPGYHLPAFCVADCSLVWLMDMVKKDVGM